MDDRYAVGKDEDAHRCGPINAAGVVTTRHLEVLRAEARYARERYDLYKARAYGQRPTSSSRMRELRRTCEGAEARLRAAETEQRRPLEA